MLSLFKDKRFWKSALTLAVPVALQNLLTSSFTLADTLLVSNLGSVALSSVGMIGQWAWLMNMVLVGFCSATTVFVSQYWGIQDIKKIRHISGISIIFALIVSVLFTAVSLVFTKGVVRIFNSDPAVISAGSEYLRIVCLSFIAVALTNILATVLRSVENVRIPMYVSGFTTVLNIFLDYCMIFGKCGFAEMGIKGAALATVVSAWAGVAILVIISVIQKNILIARLSKFFVFSKDEFKIYVKKATPVVINEGMWGIGTFIFNIIYGNMGYEYFSAITILRSFENIAFIIFIGICSASSVMIGKSIGCGKIERGITDAKRFSYIVPVLAVFTSIIVILFRNQLVSIFNMGSNIAESTLFTASILMVIYSCAFPLRMFSYLQVVSVFRSAGDTVTGVKYDLVSLWVLSLPATLIAVYALKVPFVAAFAIMYIFEDIPKVIMCGKFYLSKKWIKPVTAEGADALEKYKKEVVKIKADDGK